MVYMTTTNTAATRNQVAKAQRALDAITTIAVQRLTVDPGWDAPDLGAALTAARTVLFDPATPAEQAALLWYAVGLQAAITYGRTEPEVFNTTRPIIAALLDARIEAVTIANPFAGLVD